MAAENLSNGKALTVTLTETRTVTETLTLSNGKAHAKFIEMIEAQGGDATALDTDVKAKYSADVCAEMDGVITGIDAFEIGLTSVSLGAGRQNVEDIIEPYAGFTFHKKLGDTVKKGEAIVTAYAENETLLGPALKRSGAAIDVEGGSGGVVIRPLIGHVMDKHGMHDYEEYLKLN